MRFLSVEPPDIHHLNSAIGWLELGNHLEASADLRKITFLSQFHPDVLIVRWKVAARSNEWNRSLAIAHWLVKVAPDRPSGWICLSHSLCNTHSTLDAWRQLHEAAETFPKVSAFPYFLAKLCCRMGNDQEASQWLMKYYELESGKNLKEPPKEDPYWESVWKQVSPPENASTPAKEPQRSHS